MKSLVSFFPNEVAIAAGATLAHSLWQLSALALVLILVLALVPQTAARLRYWLSVATMGLMLILPVGTFAYLYAPQVAGGTAASTMPFVSNPTATVHFLQSTPISTSKAGIFAQVASFVQENANLFCWIWLTGVLLFSLRFLGGCWQVWRLRARNTLPVSPALQERFDHLRGQLGIKSRMELRFSTAVDTPMLIGIFKPLVLLPAGLLTGLSMEQVECILIHELAHVRRWDYAVNLAQSLVEILLFFHPATWFVTRIIRQERENCCDEWVVKLHADKVQYAHALLNLEVMRQQPRLAMGAADGDLASRIRRITGGSLSRNRRYHVRGWLFGLITLVCLTLLATQTPSVLKAALPFWPDQDKQVEKQVVETKLDSGKQGLQVQRTVSLTVPSNSHTFADLMQNVRIQTTATDSPITKVILNDRGAEVTLNFDKNGKVTSATKNGNPVPAQDLERYQDMAGAFFQGAQSRGGNPTMPPMPSMPPMGNLPPLPALPPLPQMGNGFDSAAFGADMEAFGREMEAWGENFAKQFKSEDWEQFGKNAEKWAGDIAIHIIGGEDSPERKAIQQEMDAIDSELKTTTDKDRIKELEDRKEELSDRMGEVFEQQFEIKMGDFEKKMEDMGAKLEIEMKRIQEEQEKHGDELQRQMEIRIEQDDKEVHGKGKDSDRDAKHGANVADAIQDALIKDGLITGRDSYTIKINDKTLEVNGKRQSDAMHKRYMNIVKDRFGKKVGKESVIIQRVIK